MKLADAKPGDILQDRDGMPWLVGRTNARILNDTSEGASGDTMFESSPISIDRAEKFGPFVRLVPEEDAQW